MSELFLGWIVLTYWSNLVPGSYLHIGVIWFQARNHRSLQGTDQPARPTWTTLSTLQQPRDWWLFPQVSSSVLHCLLLPSEIFATSRRRSEDCGSRNGRMIQGLFRESMFTYYVRGPWYVCLFDYVIEWLRDSFAILHLDHIYNYLQKNIS